jgi:N-acetylneuraminate synthase
LNIVTNEILPIYPLVIAEISGNHNGSLSRALEIITAAAAAGADAVKIQTYTADTITMNVDSDDFKISSDHELWPSRSLHSLYQEAHTPWEWHQEIFDYARKLGVIPFSTPFDETSVDFLEKLDCPIYKIASLEIIDIPLIAKAASTGKPLIVSSGTATYEEVFDAVQAARDAGCQDLTVLVCTSSYPAKPKDAHLARMSTLRNGLSVKVGLSDHTLGSAVAIAATALGASIIEKHVTLRRADGGVDSAFSMEPEELSKMILDCRDAADAIGDGDKWRTEAESESVRLRPSLRFNEDLAKGSVISHSEVRSVRPAGGLPPGDVSKLIGRKLTRDVDYGDPVTWDLFEI